MSWWASDSGPWIGGVIGERQYRFGQTTTSWRLSPNKWRVRLEIEWVGSGRLHHNSMLCEAEFRSRAELLRQLARLRDRALRPRRPLVRTPWPELWPRFLPEVLSPLRSEERETAFFLGSLHGDFGGHARFTFIDIPGRSVEPVLLIYHYQKSERTTFSVPREIFALLHDAIARDDNFSTARKIAPPTIID